jgi:uncharacterized RDD family membrane protein YckC
MTVLELASSYRTPEIIVRRFVATWLDLLVVFGLMALLGLVIGDAPDGVVVLGSVAIWLGYHAVLEGRLGATLGKWLSGIRVVQATGDIPGLGRGSVRSLFRLLEVNPILLGGIPAGLIADYSKYRQRLGDKVAGTFVIKIADMREHWPSLIRWAGPSANWINWRARKRTVAV